MAKINTYPKVTDVKNNQMILVTDVDGKTVNIPTDVFIKKVREYSGNSEQNNIVKELSFELGLTTDEQFNELFQNKLQNTSINVSDTEIYLFKAEYSIEENGETINKSKSFLFNQGFGLFDSLSINDLTEVSSDNPIGGVLKYTPQILTEEAKEQGKENLGLNLLFSEIDTSLQGKGVSIEIQNNKLALLNENEEILKELPISDFQIYENIKFGDVSITPTEDTWTFAIPGTYPNWGNQTITPNTIGILEYIDGVYSKKEIEFNLSPNGIVESENIDAVSGGEVYNSITLVSSEHKLIKGGIDADNGNFVPSQARGRIDYHFDLPENYKFSVNVLTSNLSIRYIVFYDENTVRVATLQDDFASDETKKYTTKTVNPDFKKVAVSFWVFGSNDPISQSEIDNAIIEISTGERTTISRQQRDIEKLKKSSLKNLNTALEYGGIRDTNGELVANFLRLRNIDFIPVKNGTTISITSNNANFYPNAVNKYLDGVFISGTTENTPFVVDNTFNQIKVSWRKTDNSRITYEENRDLEIFITDNETLGNNDELPNSLVGKSLHVIGSSNVTESYGRWSQDLSIDKKMLLTYSAIAGAQIAKKPSFAYKSSVVQLEEYVDTGVKPDILMLSSGLNDSFRTPISPLGDWEVIKLTGIDTIRATDTNNTYGINTFYGALKYIAETMILEFPNTKLIFNVPFQCWKGRADGFDLYAQAIRDVAKLYSITVIDSWAEGGFNRITEFEGEPGRYTIDGIHTVLSGNINENGRKVQRDFFCNKFTELFLK